MEDSDMQSAIEEDAGHVFLLMGQEYRISRSIRVQWFFKHFNSVVAPKPHNQLLSSTEELEVLSVLPSDPSVGPTPGKSYRLVPSTRITFIGRRYRFVFCLDISPSLATVDIQSGTVINDEVFEKFKNTLTGLVQPFGVPGNDVVLTPELFITVVAYTSILNPETPQVLIQGCLVTRENLNNVLELIHEQLVNLEDVLAKQTACSFVAESQSQESSKAESDTESDGGSPQVTLLSPEAGPMSMLRNALLAFQLLPDNASAGAVVITDGVFALPDASALDSLLAQLRASTVCCSFLKLGSAFHAHGSLGYIPHCDMMQFIAKATSGAYLARTPPVDSTLRRADGVPQINLYHKTFFCWIFQRDCDLSKIDPWMGSAVDLDSDLARPRSGSSSLSYALSEWEKNALQPSMRKRQLETKLHTSISSVLSVRLREGYTIQDISFTKGGKQLEVRLTLPWKQHVQIDYLATSAWPLSNTVNTTNVQVTVEGPYEFLHDVTYHTKQPFTSGYRARVIQRFRHAMKSLQSTDELLVHLQSFDSNSIYYTIPDSSKKGVPLFYLPPNSSVPVLSLQQARKISKSQESQFAVFWKPVLSLDTNVWQRWMHCHRIGIILEHDVVRVTVVGAVVSKQLVSSLPQRRGRYQTDRQVRESPDKLEKAALFGPSEATRPLPKNLHLPLASGRFNVVQCRMALSSLNSLLRDWSSFVLLENHSYIKFINGENPEGPPLSFCLLRISSRAPCLVIRLAFLGGTPGYTRFSIVKALKVELRTITAPLGQVAKQSKSPQHVRKKGKKTIQRLAQDKPCVIMLSKPLEKILIKYDKVPENMYSPYPELSHITGYRTNTGVYAARANENHMKVLSHYLYHHRWIWAVQDEGCRSPNPDVVARILAVLTRLRLHEGYKFVCSNAGIITLAKELNMKDNTSQREQDYACIVQYVLFPAFTGESRDAVEEWAFEGKASSDENGHKVQLVTEAWVEPQFGVFSELNPSLEYLEGLAYHCVPDAIFPKDLGYITGLLTFDHLWRMCDDQTIHTPENTLKFVPGNRELSMTLDKNWIVDELPFAYDVVQLLQNARQVEMLFSSLIEGSERDQGQFRYSELPNETLFKLLTENMEKLNDREVLLTDEECRRFTCHVVGRERNGMALPFSEQVEFETDFATSLERTEWKQSPTGRKKQLIRWRCFVRAVASVGGCGRIVLSFMPSSVRYLQSMRKCEQSPSAVASPRSPRDCFQQKLDKPGKGIVYKDIDDEIKRSLGSTLTCEECSEESTLLTEGDGSLFAKTAKGSASLEARKVYFHETEGDLTPTSSTSPSRSRHESDTEDTCCAFIIPFYAYDIPLSILTTIHEPGQAGSEDKTQGDIIQDFTQISSTQYPNSPVLLEDIPRALEGRTYGRFGSSKHLALHCSAIHDLFFHSFVLSIFSSLQRGQHVNNRDMQSAVDEICEENFVETDITDFIRTLCGHYVRRWADRDLTKEISPFPYQSYAGQYSSMAVRELLSGVCESVPGLHQSVTSKFAAIMGRSFKRVPTNPEFYYYCPQATESSRKTMSENFEDIEFLDEDKADEKEAGDADSDVFSEDDVIVIADDVGTYPEDYDSDLDESDNDNESGCSDEADGGLQPQSPLFLHLTCSLKDRTSQGTSVTAVSVKSLPLCVGEIFKKLEEADEDLSPFSPSLRLTLDLICLTLPPEPDYASLKSVSRPCPARSDSFSTCSSSFSQSPPDKPESFEFKRSDSKATSHDIEGMRSLEPLQNLPSHQRDAMVSVCDQIQWLLEDEIVAELRHAGTVTLPTLEKVAAHVQEFSHHSSCILRHVPLQFVFGAEKSMELFVKEFNKIEIEDYKLKVLGPYYYLVMFVREADVPLCASSPEQKSSSFDDTLKTDEVNDALKQAVRLTGETHLDDSEHQVDVPPEENQPSSLLTVVDEETGETQVYRFPSGESTRSEKETALFIDVEKAKLRKQSSSGDDSTPLAGGTPVLDTPLASGTPVSGTPSREAPLPDYPERKCSPGLVPTLQISDTTLEPEAELDTSVDESGSSTLSTPRDPPSIRLQAAAEDKDVTVKVSTDGSGDSEKTSGPEKVSELESSKKEEDVEQTQDSLRDSASVESSQHGAGDTLRAVLQFWLVMRFSDTRDALDVYFHRRDSDDSIPYTRSVGLVENVVNAIHDKCRIVNQRLLLQDLYDTRICNPMLEPEADEDIWKHEDLRMSVSPLGVHISKGDGSGHLYVQGQFIYQPGHFCCDAVWRSSVAVHERLRDPSSRKGLSLGLNAIKTVLEGFRVSNRKDMFVYKETLGSVFYFKLFEGLCVSDSSHSTQLEPRLLDGAEDESNREDGIESSVASLAGSRYSSTWSLRGGAAELEEDIMESKLNKQSSFLDKDAISEGGRSGRSLSGPSSLRVVEQSVVLEVHGVDEPGPEITSQLLEVLHNRLDEATLEILTVLLSRNPKCKLSYTDVWFIQPEDQDPSATLKFLIPPMDVSFLHPFSFYLTQNLLQFLTTPNYANSNPKHQFRPFCMADNTESPKQKADPKIYLYNRPQRSGGGKGLACIAVSLLDSNCQPLNIQPGRTPALSLVSLDYNYLEESTEVYCHSDDIDMDGDYVVQFAIWQRGDIGLKLLSEELKNAVRCALCDLLIEFYLLPSSLSAVPTKFLAPFLPHKRQRSVSDPVSPLSPFPQMKLGNQVYSGPQSEWDNAGPKKQLEVNLTWSSRTRATSLGQRRTPSIESPQRTPSSGSAPSKKSSRSSLSSPFLNITMKMPSIEGKEENEVFEKLKETEDEGSTLGIGDQDNTIQDGTTGVSEDDKICREALIASEAKSKDEEKQENSEKVQQAVLQVENKKEQGELPTPKPDFSKSYQVVDVVQTYETLTDAEIQESQEYTSQPGTPVMPVIECKFPSEKPDSSFTKACEDSIPAQKLSSTSLSTESASVGVARESRPPDSSSMSVQPTWKEIELRRRLDDDRRKARLQYENGEKGELHPSFHGPAQDLFLFALVLGVPSMHCVEGKVLTRYGIDIILLELVNLVNQLCPDMKPKIYRETPGSPVTMEDQNQEQPCYCTHYPVRLPLKVQREDESTADRPGQQCSAVPGAPSFYVLIGRNVDQWRASLGHEEDLPGENFSRHTKIQKNLQRFQALDANTGSPVIQDNASQCSIPVGGVPRQRLVLITVQRKEITVFTYNWAKDLNNSFDNQFQRLLHWNNARCHVTTCFMHQKMGLFHHSLFTDLNRNKKGREMNPYCLAANDMDMRMLIKQTSPSQLERERAASGSVPSAVLVFDQVLRDVTPPRPLHMLPYSHHRDPVKRHGAHYQEIRSAQVKTSVLNSKLKELYDTWQHRPPHPPTTNKGCSRLSSPCEILRRGQMEVRKHLGFEHLPQDDKVEVLKRTSRLVHFCESPLLFHPDWRRRLGTIPPGVTTDRPVEDKTTDEPPPEQDNNWSSNPPPTNSTPAPPPGEEKWHKELLMAYVQQYVQYMQSLQFVVVQTRPQSPKQSKSRSRHQFVSGRVRREHSGAVARKQSTSKESRDNLPKHFRRYLQKTSIGGIILMELSFQDCYFCVKLYALECSRIPSDKPINAQVRCMFTEECCRYKDLIHVLSFNYDLHLRNAQSFLGGRQMIFNKGYRVADMLGELLRLHPEDPGFVCNHLRRGEVAVPCEPNVCSVKVFKYIVKNSSQYDFTIVKMKALESKKHEAALLGSISQNRWNEGRMFPSLLENNDYDVTLLVTLKDKYEGGVLHLEYFVLMTSRRDLFPKLTADNSIPWTMSSSSFRSSSSSSGKSKSIPESGSVEVAPEKGGRVRFSLPRQPATTADPKRQVAGLSSSGEFHRSASTPHSLYALAHDSFPFPPVLHAQSDENLYGKKIPLGNNPKSGSPTTTDGLQEKFLNREERLLSDATEKAHDLLLHVVCRAQTHCNRDLLWYRLLAISEDEKDAGEKAKRVRKKSEYRRPTLDLAATWCRNGCLQSLLDEQELHTPHRLSLDNLKYLLSVVHRTSLKGEEDLVPLLSMNVTWYLNLIRVLMARFSDIYRLYSSEDGRVHYLAILNPNNLDMFVYLHVDESSDTADMFTVFREMPRLEEARPGDGQHFSRSVREHLYSVINAVCFHSWAGLLPK